MYFLTKKRLTQISTNSIRFLFSLTFVFLYNHCSFAVVLPHTFSNGQIADANQVNDNFTSLANAIISANVQTNLTVLGSSNLSGILYPNSDGNSGDILTTNGNGTLNWVSPVQTAGANQQIQFNNNGLPDADTELLYDKTNNHMTIGGSNINPNAALDLKSTTGAFIPPRMSTVQRNALTPELGMLIYNNAENKLQTYAISSSLQLDPASNQSGVGTGWFITKTLEGAGIFSWESLGQTFIPSLTGPLNKISLSMKYSNNPDPQVIKVSIYSGADMTASPTLIASETLTVTSNSYSWYDVTLSSSPTVFSGNSYVITCVYDNPCDATAFNRVEWQRNTNSSSYPRNWSDSESFSSCGAVHDWVSTDNANRYIHKLWITTTANTWINLY